jgi:hypothetical protein
MKQPMTVGMMREILAHYPAEATVEVMFLNMENVTLRPSHTTFGDTRVAFWANAELWLQILNEKENEIIEKMRNEQHDCAKDHKLD